MQQLILRNYLYFVGTLHKSYLALIPSNFIAFPLKSLFVTAFKLVIMATFIAKQHFLFHLILQTLITISLAIIIADSIIQMILRFTN